jgi:iron(III) transport system permease protein
LLAPFAAMIFLRRAVWHWPAQGTPLAWLAFRRALGGRWFGLAGAVGGVTWILAVVLPLAPLATASRTWLELPGVLQASASAIWNTVSLATGAGLASVALGLFSWRWPIGWLTWLPFLLPGVLVALGLIALFNRPVLAAVYGTAWLVWVGWTLRYLPLAWQGANHALRAVDRTLLDAARLEGAGAWGVFRLVYGPQAGPQLAVAWYVIYLLCLWDVEMLVLLAPPGGETLALRIFNLLHYGHNAQANALCVVLLGLAVGPLVAWRVGRRMTKDA